MDPEIVLQEANKLTPLKEQCHQVRLYPHSPVIHMHTTITENCECYCGIHKRSQSTTGTHIKNDRKWHIAVWEFNMMETMVHAAAGEDVTLITVLQLVRAVKSSVRTIPF